MKTPIVLCSVAFLVPVAGADYQWDTNGIAAGLGGTGVWDTANPYWDAMAGGVNDGTDAPLPYSFTNADKAVFGGTAGAVTLGTGVTLNGLEFNAPGYTLAGNTLTLAGATPAITANSDAAVSSILAGTAGLGKAGAGNLTLTGFNTFTGGTTVNAGNATLSRGAGFGNNSGSVSTGDLTIQSGATATTTIAFAISGNTGSGNNRVVNVNGGILNLAASEYIRTYHLTGATVNAPVAANDFLRTSAAGLFLNSLASENASTINNKIDLTFAGVVCDIADGAAASDLAITGPITQNTGAGSGSRTLTKTGAGNLVLSGSTANTFNGLTTVSAGTLTLDKNDGIIALAGNVLVNGTGLLFASANRSGRIADAANVTIDGPTASFSLGANQNDTINILAINNGGTVSIGGAATNLRPNGGITSTGGGSITQSAGAGGLNFNGAVRSITVADNSLSIATPITNGGLTKLGNGTLTLTAPSTYTNATTISAGTLALAGSGSIATTPLITVSAGATFEAGSSFILRSTQEIRGNGRVAGSLTVDAPGGTITAEPGTLTVSTLVFSGAGTLNLTPGTATLDVTSANSLTLNGGPGSVVINIGTSSIPAGNYRLLKFSGSLQGTGLSAFILGTNPGGGFNYEMVQTTDSIDLKVTTQARIWTGASSSEWNTSVLAAPKNWSRNSVSSDFATGEDVIFNDAAGNNTVTVSPGNVSPATCLFQNATKPYLLQGSSGITGTTGLVKSGTALLTITNTNSFTGDVSIETGALQLPALSDTGTAGALGSGATVRLKSGTLRLTGPDSSTDRTFELTFNNSVEVTTPGTTVALTGTMTGTGGLIKSGPGKLVISGNGDYAGPTIITGGTLRTAWATALGTTANGTSVASGTALDLAGSTIGAEPLTLSGSGPDGLGVLINGDILPATITGPVSLLSDIVMGGSGDLTLRGALSGAFALNKKGAGNLTLAGRSTMTGNVLVEQGILTLGATGPAGNPVVAASLGAEDRAVTKVTVASGAAVDFNGQIDNVYGYTISGNGPAGEGALVNKGAALANTFKQASNIKLAADASIGGTANWALLTAGFAATSLDLNGKTLTKTGPNTVTLANTTVTAGTLVAGEGTLSLISGTTLDDAVNVRISAVNAAALNLGAAAVETVATLFVDGVAQAAGDYVAAGSTAAGTVLGVLTGNGVLRVLSGPTPTFAAWLAAYPGAAGFQADSDLDGIPNGIEHIFGTSPMAATTGLEVLGATAVTVSFRHPLNPSIASDVNYSYQWSTDLVEWKASGATNAGGTTATITTGVPAGGMVTVTTTVSAGPRGLLFTRLNASNP